MNCHRFRSHRRHPFNRTAPVVGLTLLLLSGIVPAIAFAQTSSGAASTFVDPSIAAAGMGRAGSAAFWSDRPNSWANPALLGFHRGIQYLYGRTQLVPDLADDVYFTTRELILGGGGIGVSLAGKPFDSIGELRLDYGKTVVTDVNGNAVGEFSSFEEIHQLAVGVNLLEAFESLQRLSGREPSRLSRRVDLSVGHSWKSVVVDLAPASVTLDGRAARGEATERDRGLLLRVTPLNRIADGADGRSDEIRCRLDAAVGFSQRNYGDSQIFYIDEDQSDPLSEERLLAGAARLRVVLPGAEPGGIWDLLSPSLSVGLTLEKVRYYDNGNRLPGETETRSGQEITIADLLSVRHGYIDDPTGTIQDHTWGVGARLHYKEIIGASFDWARVPQSVFLDKVDRRGFTLFLDPLRAWRELR